MYAAYPSADIPATWFVLGGDWLLLLALQRKNVWLALAAGVLLGIACWFRVNPLYLCVGWAIALFALVPSSVVHEVENGCGGFSWRRSL